MAFNDTENKFDADTKALKLGAVVCCASYYPSHRPAVWQMYEREVFAYHYFGVDGLEVGYYIPRMASFHALEKHREWSDKFLSETVKVPLSTQGF